MPRKGMRCLFLQHKSPPSSLSPEDHSTTSRLVSPANVDLVIATATLIIDKWNPQEPTSLFRDCKREAMQLIKSVNNLQKSMVLLIDDDPASEKLVRAQKLMQIAMDRLQKEFYQIQSMNRAYLHPESVSARTSLAFTRSSTSSSFDAGDESQDESRISGDEVEELASSASAMADLRAIADCMIANGYAKECVSIYRTIRKSVIDESIFRLGVEKLNSSQVNKMDWETVDRKTRNWLDAVKIAVKTLFHGEKILSDEVFSSSPSIRESTFSYITGDGAAILFGFPEKIITKFKKKSGQSEIIFRILDMYAAITENWQQIQSIFSSESTATIRLQALNSLVQLSEFIRPFLSEFEKSLHKDSSKAVPPGGGVDSLTVETMNHLSLLADYSSILGEILPPDVTSLAGADTSVTPFSRQLQNLVFVVLCKLDGKSKHHKNVALSYLFLANNLQHVISKARSSNLCYLLGSDWISEQERKIKQFAGTYERIAWGPVVASLPEISTIRAMTPATANEAIKRFHSVFSEACRKQRSWIIVPDGNLRDEMKMSIAKKIMPVYRELYDYSQKLIMADNKVINISSVSVVRFTPEDVANCLSDLFFGAVNVKSGSPSSTSLRRRRRLWSPFRFTFTTRFISNFISTFM